MSADSQNEKSPMNIGSVQHKWCVLSRGSARPMAGYIVLVSLYSWMTLAASALAQNEFSTGNSLAAKPLPHINPNGWTSSAVCGECHQAIHAVWRESMHAKAWSDAVFQAGYHRSIDAYGKSRSRFCLTCHAPTVRMGHEQESGGAEEIEGVTCDFCHSIKAVELSDTSDPIRLNLGETKYGPLRRASSPAHQVVHSELHGRSELCAACHEYRNAQGVTVLGTYSEWKESTYAKKGQQCQSCHMPEVPGRVVALNVKPDAGKSINLHNISGSHNMDRVRGAVTLELAGYEWIGDHIGVYITVANQGSGHCFPTGMPMHRAYLDVAIYNGSRLVDERKIPFGIIMLDKDGRPITHEHELMVEAASVRSDTRLRPNEVRTIDVSFRNIKATDLMLTANLYYEYSTEALVKNGAGEHMKPVTMSFAVASRRNSMRRDAR